MMLLTKPQFLLTGILCATASVSSVSAQVPDGYEIVRLGGLGVYSRPDMNNGSDVIWSDSIPSSSISHIYLFRDGIIRRLTDGTFYDIRPAINDDGSFVHTRAIDFFGPFDVVLHDGNGETSMKANEAVNSQPDINNSGHVVWEDKFSLNGPSDERVFVYDGDGVHQVTFNGICNHFPQINNCGQIVINAKDINQVGSPSTILLYDSGELAALTDDTKNRGGQRTNDLGQIVWAEQDTSGFNDRIMLWEDGAATVLVDGGGQGVAAPGISNTGNVTFVQWNEALSLWELWLYRAVDQSFMLLPHLGFTHAGTAAMNECDEFSWRATEPNSGEKTMFLLRRIAPKGDFNHDCRIDTYDFAILESCFTGENNGPAEGLLGDCTRADFDEDGDVDAEDADALVKAVLGPAQPVSNCTAIEECGS